MTTNIVIGAASGMGAAVARRMASRGERLILADIAVDRVHDLARTLEAEVEVLRCDVSSREDLEAVADAAGSVGAVIVTAGISPTMAGGRRIYEVDLVGPAHFVQAFEPYVGPGSVAVLFASMAAHMVPPMAEFDAVLDRPLDDDFFDALAGLGLDIDHSDSAYAFAKRGVLRLVRREAGRWGAKGARLVSLSPGIVETPMGMQEASQQPAMAEMVTRSALGRMLTADEVAVVADFLASAAASGITGTDVLVDGGAVASST